MKVTNIFIGLVEAQTVLTTSGQRATYIGRPDDFRPAVVIDKGYDGNFHPGAFEPE